MNHDRVTREGQETAALYALGALSQREACTFDTHLREGCPACDQELEQFSRVVEALGSAPMPVAAPAYLRDLLTARIERETLEPSVSSVLPFPEHASATQLRSTPRPSYPVEMLIPWAVAAALLIAFVATFAAWRTNSQTLNAAIDQRASAIEENARLKDSLGDAGAASTELAQINSVLSTPQFRFISLAGQEVAPNSSASIYWDTQGNRWVVTADLPPAPEGKVYQLWFVTPAAKISAGLINPNKKGHAFTSLSFPTDITELAAAAITLEPEGGSDQPTMPIYALGKAS